MSEKSLTANINRKLKTPTVVFALLLTFGAAAAYAQSINDDLKPKTSAPKSKPAVKTSIKPRSKKVSQSKQTSTKSIKARVNPVKNYESNSLTAETPDQIFNRFMNFQQSSGVTVRDWNSVLAQTAKTLENNPNNMVAKAQSLIAQGQLAYSQSNYAMATIHFKAALQILPQSSLPHYGLGKTYLANGQAAAAERSFKQAIEQNENFALAYKGLGDAYAAQGEKKKATKYFKKATEIGVKSGNTPL